MLASAFELLSCKGGSFHFEVMSAQAAAEAQRNGVVRLQERGGARSSGAHSVEVGTEVPTVPLQTAGEFLAEVQSREQVEDAGARVDPGASVEGQTAADTINGDVGAVGSLGSTGSAQLEAQTGMEIGPQRAAIALVLAEHENSVNLDQAADVPVNGAHTGFHTPRSSRSAQVSGFGALRSSVPGQWPGWVSRLGDLFKAPPIPNTWLPSPISSPPPPPGTGGQWGAPPPFGQRMDAPADGGKGYPKGSRSMYPSNTPSSSSIPAEAIQAEVQRQMGSILTRLSEVESDNVRLQMELQAERLKASAAGSASGPAVQHARPKVPVRDPGPAAEGSEVLRSNVAPLPAVPEGRSEAWSKLWEGITGKRTPKAPMPELHGMSTSSALRPYTSG